VQALAAYSEQRRSQPSLPEIIIYREHTLPDLTGYYRSAFGGDYLIAGSDSPALATMQGVEFSLKAKGRDLYDLAGTSFDSTGAQGSWHTQHHVHLGTVTHFSRYTRDPGWVHITSGSLRPNLDQEDLAIVSIMVAVDGTYPRGVCTLDYWYAHTIKSLKHIEASNLAYMCVDENAGYAPGEDWVRADSSSCTCSDSREVVCE
jgi:hypothetical protein